MVDWSSFSSRDSPLRRGWDAGGVYCILSRVTTSDPAPTPTTPPPSGWGHGVWHWMSECTPIPTLDGRVTWSQLKRKYSPANLSSTTFKESAHKETFFGVLRTQHISKKSAHLNIGFITVGKRRCIIRELE